MGRPKSIDKIKELTVFRTKNLANAITVTKLPEGVEHNYGCKTCEWKLMNICPHKFREEHEATPAGICEERQNYLKGFYRGNKTEPNFTEWESDFLQGKGIETLQMDEYTIKLINEKLAAEEVKLRMEQDEVERERIRDIIFRLGRRLEYTKNLWQKQWQALRNLQELRLNREAPRKLEITHKQDITIDDFNKLMRRTNEDTIEAEYEVLKDDNDEG